MLPHNSNELRTILELIGQGGAQAIIADMRHIVSKLTHDLIMCESEREVVMLQGSIRCLTDLIDRYTRPSPPS